MTDRVVVHHVSHSRSFRVLWLLEEMGIDYDLEFYKIPDGSMRAPEYLEKSPAGPGACARY